MPKASCKLCHKTWAQENISKFHVPQDAIKRKKWSESCGVELQSASKICSLHFSSADFVSGANRKRVKLSQDALPVAIESIYSWNEMNNNSSKFVDVSTQTESYEDCRVALLEAEVEKLKNKLAEFEKLKTSVQSIFTEGQVRKLRDGDKNVHWTWNDISSAIALHAAGPRAYVHLCKNGFPFPGESTIRRWLLKIKVDDGVLNFSLNIMRRAKEASVEDRLCIICFDEMKVEAIYEYDPVNDTIRNPCNYVQVVIARGLKSSWKQPVVCAYDCKITKCILDNLIQKIHESGFNVVGMVGIKLQA